MCLITSEVQIPYNIENDSFIVTEMIQSINYWLPDGNSNELIEDRILLIERVFLTIKNHNFMDFIKWLMMLFLKLI